MQAVKPVNRPKGHTDWQSINWRKTNRIVRNLRQRIFRATTRGDYEKVRSLQKLMLRCYSNLLLSVRKVTQLNTGKNTPGVDRVVVKTPTAREKLVDELSIYQPWKTQPARRVYIPKANGKQRPLGIVKYADDFTVFCETREDAQKCLELLSEWLALRGLALSTEKTRITHLTEGFDFLGFHFQHYLTPHTPTGWKLLITPSRQSVQKLRTRLRSEWLKLRGHNLPAVLRRLNPKIRGWANYFRIACSSKVFNKLDSWMFHRQIRWGKHSHPTKPWKWLESQYWGRFNLDRKDNWVFGDKHSGAYLLKFSWFSIQRHVLVKGRASPDDPSLREYWQKREKAQALTLVPSYRKIAQKQAHKCPICGESLYNGELIQRHHIKPKSKSGKDSYKNLQLVHLYCHQQLHATEDVNS